MKFGSVEEPEKLNLNLPPDHPETQRVLEKSDNGKTELFVGCAKWNRQELKNCYPRGTPHELKYYAAQFNHLERNATHYRNFAEDQSYAWCGEARGYVGCLPKVNCPYNHLRCRRN